MKVAIIVQRIAETLSRMQSRMSITFKRIFLGEYHICNIYTYIQKISFFHVFLEKDHLSFSFQRKNIIFSRKKTIFPDNARKIIFQRDSFLKDHLFEAFEENIIFPRIFFYEKDYLSFPV